jgi:two-component system, NarL family, nitrate/nitrite response regulator NarL
VPDPTQFIRIVIADNRPIFRDGLRRLLETESGLRIVGETGSGPEAVALVREMRADILLLDFSPSALQTLKDLAGSRASVCTILLVDSLDDPALAKALEIGARGLVLKDSTAEVLFESIRVVKAGYYWIASDQISDAPSLLRRLEAERRRRRAFGLTRRELEIVRMVVAGYTNKEIAEQFAIGENTVKSHLTHIFNKLGASSRVELALFAAHHRLLDGI